MYRFQSAWQAHAILCCLFLAVLYPRAGCAGVVNPQISIIGQPTITWTNDPESPDPKRPRLDPGETELVYDDYLNPYARGFFTLSLAETGLELEEGYFTVFRGLPLGLALKGGQYRVPFGRINQAHPHTYPFAEPFAVLQTYLPGEEATIEPGVELSRRIALVGDTSVNLQADWLQGDTFRIERESSGDAADPLELDGDDRAGEGRPAFLGRVSTFSMLGERSGLELGVSAMGGTNNVAAGTRTRVYGVDAKVKLWQSAQAYLLLQGEALRLDRDVASWSPTDGYTDTSVSPSGGYLFADYNFGIRYNVGASYERFQEPEEDKPVTEGVGAFVGYALMEETTAFRLDWRRMNPAVGDSYDTAILRVIFSMGPHKAHQF